MAKLDLEKLLKRVTVRKVEILESAQVDGGARANPGGTSGCTNYNRCACCCGKLPK